MAVGSPYAQGMCGSSGSELLLLPALLRLLLLLHTVR
jgi:hypothetical protein